MILNSVASSSHSSFYDFDHSLIGMDQFSSPEHTNEPLADMLLLLLTRNKLLECTYTRQPRDDQSLIYDDIEHFFKNIFVDDDLIRKFATLPQKPISRFDSFAIRRIWTNRELEKKENKF